MKTLNINGITITPITAAQWLKRVESNPAYMQRANLFCGTGVMVCRHTIGLHPEAVLAEIKRVMPEFDERRDYIVI